MSKEKNQITVSALIYALQSGRVLLQKSTKQTILGQWVAPGGKVQMGESPYEAAQRVFLEETGYQANILVLRGLVTLVNNDTEENSLYFLYACNDFSGELNLEGIEGPLSWQHLHRVFQLQMPVPNQRFFTHAINLNLPLYQARYTINSNGDLIDIIEF